MLTMRIAVESKGMTARRKTDVEGMGAAHMSAAKDMIADISEYIMDREGMGAVEEM